MSQGFEEGKIGQEGSGGWRGDSSETGGRPEVRPGEEEARGADPQPPAQTHADSGHEEGESGGPRSLSTGTPRPTAPLTL